MKTDKSKACLTGPQIEVWLKKAGVNATAQRIAICQYVLCQGDHPTAEEVKSWADLNFPKISLATVYNTLNTLVEAGLLREYHFPHSEKTIYDNNIIDHHHLLDEKTQKLIDIDSSMISVNREGLKNIEIKKIDVVLYGKILEEGEK